MEIFQALPLYYDTTYLANTLPAFRIFALGLGAYSFVALYATVCDNLWSGYCSITPNPAFYLSIPLHLTVEFEA
ncbi:MAG: hypothetical protein LC116_02935 [Bacteroidetes bacterium]|nr:hypothetical protein [Bacteroidota bacterium]